MSEIIDKIKSLPRAARWGLIALVAFGVYFLVVERVLDRINAAGSKADDRIGALLSLSHDPSQTSDIDLGIRKFGVVALPGEAAARSVAFNRRVVEVLAKHKIKNSSTSGRTMPMAAGPLKDAYGEERVERLVQEIQFDATPEDISAVIADLESSPEVAAVSRIQIRRGSKEDTAARLLKATIGVEAWVLGKRAGGGPTL